MNPCCYVSFSMSPYLQCLVLLAKPTWSLNHFRQAVLLRPMKYSFLYSKMFLPNLNHPRFLLFKQFKSHLVINLSENLLISHIYLNPLMLKASLFHLLVQKMCQLPMPHKASCTLSPILPPLIPFDSSSVSH